MKQLINAAQAPGARANKISMFRLSVICAFTVFSWTATYAQSYDTIPVTNYPFTISCPDGSYQSGDTVEFTISIGSASNQVNAAYATDLSISLSSKANVPANGEMDMTHSWLFSDGIYTDNFAHDPLTSRLSLQAWRADGTRPSGYGELMRFRLIANQNVSSGAELISDGGGVMILDNLDMKTAPASLSAELAQPRLYPNPASDYVMVQIPHDQQCTRLEILNLNGQVLSSQAIVAGNGDQRLDLSSIDAAAGLCIVRVLFADGQAVSKPLLRKN